MLGAGSARKRPGKYSPALNELALQCLKSWKGLSAPTAVKEVFLLSGPVVDGINESCALPFVAQIKSSFHSW